MYKILLMLNRGDWAQAVYHQTFSEGHFLRLNNHPLRATKHVMKGGPTYESWGGAWFVFKQEKNPG